jgi:F0F1-type ATP synthase assembly protein I
VSTPSGSRSTASGVGWGMSLAFEFAGAVFLFWLIGRAIDGWLGSEPWAQLVGALVGWIGGTLHVYYAVQRRSGAAAARRGRAGSPRPRGGAEGGKR